jgi:hypothetical protein
LEKVAYGAFSDNSFVFRWQKAWFLPAAEQGKTQARQVLSLEPSQ